ncbi:hypothetical protein V1515DRAFT_577712 [Lipomyces mesembrius]
MALAEPRSTVPARVPAGSRISAASNLDKDEHVRTGRCLPSPLNVSPNEKDFVVVDEKVTSSSTSASTDLEAQTKAVPTQWGPLGLEDPNLVTMERPDDPANPMSFNPLASSMLAPGVHNLVKAFNSTNSTLASFFVSIYILGFAIGPLVVAPLSEMYGRSIVYKVSTFMFTAFTIGASKCNLVSMFVLRLLSGLIGSTSIALGSGRLQI